MRKRWQRLITLTLAVLLTVSLASVGTYAGSQSDDLFANPGVHVVSVPGWIGSPIISTVTVNSDRILSIQTNHGETNGFGDIAINAMTAQILANQTINVDIVSGATLTSVAFLGAMHQALFTLAGGDRTRLMTRPPAVEFSDTVADVVVVGAGAAGFAAAIRVASERPDWNVILLEADGILGGITLRAGAGTGASAAEIQIRSGFMGNRLAADGGGPIETARDDVRAHGGNAALEGEFSDFFRLLAANSKYLVDYANELRGKTTANAPGAHGVVTGHRSVMPRDFEGFTAAIRGLEATALYHGVDIRVNNRGRFLLNANGDLAGPTCPAIGGIRVETASGSYDIMLNPDNPNAAVVLATGGIAGNQELTNEFFPNAEFGVNTNIANTMYFASSPASARHQMGDGQIMGRQVGAALDMMHAITTRAQGIPGQDISGIANVDLPFQDNFMSGAIPRSRGLLYFSYETGRRFSDEPNVPTYDFFDDNGVPLYYWGIMTHAGVVQRNSIMGWYKGGLFQVAYTIEEAADLIGFTGDTRTAFIDEMRQIQHVATHNVMGGTQADAIEAARNCNDSDCAFHGVAICDDFFPNSANTITNYLWSSGPFYVTSSRIVPIIHGTYGGIRININGQAVRGTNRHHQVDTLAEAELDDVIPGLYAAGTVARPPRGAAPNVSTSGVWGIAAANHILGLPSFDNSYWE